VRIESYDVDYSHVNELQAPRFPGWHGSKGISSAFYLRSVLPTMKEKQPLRYADVCISGTLDQSSSSRK
jgi:hypothetical protein